MKELNIGEARKDIGKIVRRTVWPIATMGIAGISVIGCNPFNKDATATPTPTPSSGNVGNVTVVTEGCITVLDTKGNIRQTIGDCKTPTAPKPTATPKTPESTTTPTATPKPTDTPTPEPTKTPKSIELPNENNFRVAFNQTTGKCEVLDRNTGKVIDASNHPVAVRRRIETGVGTTKIIQTNLEKGQVAIIEGWKVDDKGEGVFITVNAIKDRVNFTNKISDGAITIVDSKDGPVAFCNAVNTAVTKNFAHQVVTIPPEWK